MLNDGKGAAPGNSVTIFVPESVPTLGMLARAMVMSVLKPATVLPASSCAAACTAGELVPPAMVLVGCTVKTRCVAGRGVMLNAALVAPVTPGAVVVATSV